VTCMSPAQCSYTSVLYNQRGLSTLGMKISVYKLILGITQNEDPALTGMFSDEEGIADTLILNPLASLYNEPMEIDEDKLQLSDLASIEDADELISLLNKTFNVNIKLNEKDVDGSLKKFMKDAFLKNKMNLNYEYLPYAFGFTGANLKTPMFVIGSWYDMFIQQNIRDLMLIQKNSPDFFKTNFRMVIGPGAHAGMDFVPLGIVMPPTIPPIKKMLNLYQHFIPFKWYFDHFLKRDGRFLSKVPPISAYIMNTGKWRHLSKWPPRSIETKFYLHSNGRANSIFGDGKLSPEIPRETGDLPDEYEFDPANPVVTNGGRFLMFRSGGLNQAKLEERKDILVYTTEKLKEGIEVLGDVKIELHASSTVKDTDFMVKLVDVHSKKKAINIVDDGIRVRFRDGLKNPKPIEPGKVYKYVFPIGSTGIYFKKGHRIRIEVTSSNFPRFDVNSNLAGEKSKKKYKHAIQTIYHDATHPSCLILPVFKPKK
ncbi:MAG: CocE/NonD family hydrolase, partial [Candidatus Helarchaeota archaeon]